LETLYVLEPGSYMRVQGEGLRIEKEGNLIEEIPAARLKRLTLIGRCSMTGAVLDFLIDRKIDTVFMSLTGRFRAHLLLDAPGHVALRQLQYARLGDDAFKLKTASMIVAGKIANQRDLLLKRAYRQRLAEVRRIAVQLRALEKRASRAKDLEELRGIEGGAARAFYAGFGMLIKNGDFHFGGRNKRPPRDPVNALLSFVYTMFTNEVLNAINASGLDPYLGALHEPAHGRPSLACDLVEEWRATAEAFVLTLLNKRMVGPEDFVETGKRQRPIEMAPRFVRALIKGYEKKMSQRVPFQGEELELRWVIYRRIRQFIEHLRQPSTSWRPWRLES